jgi:hypothetical protein
VLYDNPARRNAVYGGNAWKAIAMLVWRLAAALEKDHSDEASGLLTMLSRAQHNTGSVMWLYSSGHTETRKLRITRGVFAESTHNEEVAPGI